MRAFLVLLLIGGVGPARAELTVAAPCQELVVRPSVEITTTPRGTLVVNGRAARVYPLEVVLRHLGLTPGHLPWLRGKRVVLLGEGFGELLPWLRANQVRGVWAIDLSYGARDIPDTPMGQLLRTYGEAHRDHLITGSASALPLADGSADVILSHMLLGNVAPEDRTRVLSESARVLPPGGIGIFAYQIGERAGAEMHARLNRLSEAWPGLHYRVESQESRIRMGGFRLAPDLPADETRDMIVNRLTLRR